MRKNHMTALVGMLCLCAGAAYSETFEDQVSAAVQTASTASRSARKAAAAVKSEGPAAASEPAWVEECRAVGYRKLEDQAKAYGIKVDMKTFRINEKDGRGYLGSKYAWWSVDVTDVNGRTDVFPPGAKPVLTTLTQKPMFNNCF